MNRNINVIHGSQPEQGEPQESFAAEPKSFGQPDEQIAQDSGGSHQSDEGESHTAFNFQKLENQLKFEQAIQQGQEILLQERKNGKNQGFREIYQPTKSSQKANSQTTENIRSKSGANRSHPSNSPNQERQETGNHSPSAYIKEWVEGSGVDADVVWLNVRYLEGDEAYSHLCYSDRIERLNSGRIAGWVLKRYGHIEEGGWWCSGIDVLTGEHELWGCFKPNKPKIDQFKGKNIKYEHPAKEPTGIFALRVPPSIWNKISQRYGVEILPSDIDQSRADFGFWKWVIAHPEIPIIVTEGAKKAGALLSAGFAAIALPGIWNGIRKGDKGKHTLIPQLEAFAQPDRKIYFAFDQDEKRSTRKANRKALWATGRLLKDKGCEVRVIEWEPTVKGVDDLIVSRGERYFFSECYDKALDFDYWSADWLSLLTYKPALKLDSSTKYIGDFAPPPSAKLICLKAPKGSGKTEWLVKVCEDAQYRGQKVLVLTHRTQLGIDLARRFGMAYVDELSGDSVKGLYGVILCFDSLRKNSQARFDPEEWHGCIVILDECEQSIWHLLNSSTEVKNHRVEILRNYQQVIKNSLADEDGKVILSDAALSDVSIDYIKSLSEFLLNLGLW